MPDDVCTQMLVTGMIFGMLVGPGKLLDAKAGIDMDEEGNYLPEVKLATAGGTRLVIKVEVAE